MPKNESVLKQSIRMVVSLFIICALTAGVVAGVYALTLDKINENLEGEIRSSIEGMFGEGVVYETLENIPDGAEAVYKIVKDGATFYCVNLNASGFGGDVNMLVSVGEDGRYVGVSVVSHSETPGFGEKATKSDYLDAFKGTSSATEVEMISGATISSKAIRAGVTSAKEMLVSAGLVNETANGGAN